MESHSHRPVKRTRLSLWLCNELVWEFCSAIPIVNTWERILLTSANIHTYLGPRFRNMWVYRDLIVFLKAKLKANKYIGIRIDQVNQNKNKESEPIVIDQKHLNDKFVLENNYLRIQINEVNWNQKMKCTIYESDDKFECAQLLYFLCLIAPLVQPIHLDFCLSHKPTDYLMRFLNAFSGYINSIGLTSEQFNSAAVDEALGKYNKLEIFWPWCKPVPVNMPKLVRWLTTQNNNTNGRSKKYLFFEMHRLEANNWLIQMLDEIKKDFDCATNEHRFFVRLEFRRQSLDEFTKCNEWTGERLELRRIGSKYGLNFYALSRFPTKEMDNIEANCAEFDPQKMTKILFDR